MAVEFEDYYRVLGLGGDGSREDLGRQRFGEGSRRFSGGTAIARSWPRIAGGPRQNGKKESEGRIIATGIPDEIQRNPNPRVEAFLNDRMARRLAALTLMPTAACTSPA